MQIKTLPFLLAGLLAIPAAADRIADSSAAAAPVASAADNAPAQPRGILYRVRQGDHTSYLLGTIRFGHADYFPIGGEAQQDFSGADSLLLELDTRNKMPMQDAVKKFAMYQNKDTLDKHVAPATLAALKQVLDEAKIPYDIVSHMKPWMAANVLTAVTLERKGYRISQATDTWFLKAAIAQKKPIEGFSDADAQLGRYDSMNARQQESYLRETLAGLQSGATVAKTQQLVEAWANADGKALEKIAADLKSDKSTQASFTRKVLQEQHNPVMVAHIEARLKQDKTSFACIDVMNLLGDKSVPQLLARDGFEVTRLY